MKVDNADVSAYFDEATMYIPDLCMSADACGRICQNNGSVYGGLFGRLFDGIDDLITCASDPIGTNACTIVVTFLATGWGGGNTGRILDNGPLFAYLSNTGTLRFRGDGSTEATSGANSIALNTIYRVVITRTTSGATNFHINGNLSGTANQASGTPTAGNQPLTFGNRAASDKGFKGNIRDIEIYVGQVWSPVQVQQDFLATRWA